MYIWMNEGLGDNPLSEPKRARLGKRSKLPYLRFLSLDGFGHNKFSLTDDHRNMLDILVKHVEASWKTTQPIGFIHLIGHSDSTGEEKYNVGLGNKRAKEVEKALLGHLRKQGLSGRVGVVVEPSPGRTEPTADDRTSEGRKRNRRVEVFVMPPAPPIPKPPRKYPWPVPDDIKKRMEERDQERRYNEPTPPPLPSKSLQDWLDERLDRLPQRRWVRDAILKGGCSLLEEVFEREGGTLSDNQKEDFRKQCRDAPKKSR